MGIPIVHRSSRAHDPWLGDVVVVRHRGRSAVLRASGEFDFDNAAQLRDALCRELAIGHDQVRLGMSDVRFIDAAGVGALAAARHAFRVAHGTLLISDPSRVVRRVLAITGLERDLLGER